MKNVLTSPLVRAASALVLILALGALFHADGAFFKWTTHRDMLRYISVFAVLACGMTVVIIAGGIDLSVGSVLGLSAVLFSMLTIHRAWSPWLAIPATMAAGAACGLVSGWVAARFRVQPFIATLAMMVFARGLAKLISGGQKVSSAIQRPDGSYTYVEAPPIFEALSARVLGGNIAVVTLIFLVCLLFTGCLLRRMVWGRRLYAIGGNEEAARLSGVPVVATKMLAYGLAGVFSAVAGMCQAAQERQGDPEAGVSYELTAIAIVVIGGTRLAGGRGGIGLTLAGVLTIGYLEKILSINAVSEALRLILTGLIIVLAVIFQQGAGDRGARSLAQKWFRRRGE
jgi:ribose transport system permease protein